MTDSPLALKILKVYPKLRNVDKIIEDTKVGRRIYALREICASAQVTELRESVDIFNRISSMINGEDKEVAPVEAIKEFKEENAKKALASVKIDRDMNGLTIHIKSEDLETFIKQATSRPDVVASSSVNGYLTHQTWPGVRFYHPPTHEIFQRSCQVGGALMINGAPNLALICAKGLSNGVTYNLKGLYTNSQINEFRRKFKSTLNEIYREFMKPFGQEIEILFKDL